MNGEVVDAFAQMVARWFVARGAPARLADEMRSAAALAVVDTHRRYGLPLVQGNRGYYFTAAKRAVAEEIKQALHPYRLGGRLAKRGIFELPTVVSVDDLADRLGGAAGPEQALEDNAQRVAAQRLLARVYARALRSSPSSRRRLLPILREKVMPEVPRRRSRNSAWQTFMRVAGTMRDDQGARRDRCVMIGKEDLAA